MEEPDLFGASDWVCVARECRGAGMGRGRSCKVLENESANS